MVCPNCHSTDIIAVQDQHFCISCGQMVPEAVVKAAEAKVAAKTPAKVAVAAGAHSESKPAEPLPVPSEKTGYATIVEQRHRLTPDGQDEPHVGISGSDAKTKPKSRKPGRPKLRLDVPLTAALPAAPKIKATPQLPPEPPPVVKSETASELAPLTKTLPHSHPHPHADTKKPRQVNDIRPPEAKREAPKAPSAHKLGVAPVHYGSVLSFSLRSQARPRWLLLGAAATAILAAAFGYTAWIYLSGGLPRLANLLAAGTPQLLAELAVLAALYYIGRSLSQTAIIYGLAREADHRPVPLSRQFGIGINTFTRRLGLDTGFAILELALVYLIGTLILIGGTSWPVNLNLQIIAIFSAFLILLYLLTALALAKGLAGVALTLGPTHVVASAKLGWRLFSHRLEIVFMRFLAVAIELTLILPLAAVAAALIVAAPPALHLEVALGIGLLALIAGALLGAGTAAWWTALYRRLVELQPGNHDDSPLLTNHQPSEARRGPLTFIVALSTLLIAAALALPWLKF